MKIEIAICQVLDATDASTEFITISFANIEVCWVDSSNWREVHQETLAAFMTEPMVMTLYCMFRLQKYLNMDKAWIHFTLDTFSNILKVRTSTWTNDAKKTRICTFNPGILCKTCCIIIFQIEKTFAATLNRFKMIIMLSSKFRKPC